MSPFRFDVSLRIQHPTADPAAMSDAVGLRPKWAWKVGEQRRTPKQRLLEGFHAYSYCCFDIASGADGQLAQALCEALTDLEERADLLHSICDTGGKAEFFIGWFSDANTGEVFTSELLSRLARLKLALALDVYGCLE